MNTIKCGKLFCQAYNEDNGTEMTAKEIFCNVITPLLFDSHKHLINWSNSKFFYELRNIKKGKIYDYKKALNSFCDEVENDSFGVMTSLNVFAGCAKPDFDEGQTTLFSYSDNLYFGIDERYCSFIGSAFSFNCDGWYVVINDKKLIYETYKGIIEYRRKLDNNNDIADKQLQTWNTLYLYSRVYNENTDYILDKFTKLKNKKRALNTNGIISFTNFLFLLSKKELNIKTLEVQNLGETNATCGAILIDLNYVKTTNEFYKQIYSESHSDFNQYEFDKLISTESIVLRKAISIGRVYKGFFNPIDDIKYYNAEIKKSGISKKEIEEIKLKINFKIKYIKLIMDEEDKKIASEFALKVKKCIKNSKKNLYDKDFFRETDVKKLINKLIDLNKVNNNDDFLKVINWLQECIGLKNRERFDNFRAFSEIEFINL